MLGRIRLEEGVVVVVGGGGWELSFIMELVM